MSRLEKIVERRSGIDRRKDEMEFEIKELRNTIFTMLNFTSLYALVLDQQMKIRFINTSLAIDLGYTGYSELIGRCWLDFIVEEERNIVKMIHQSVALAEGNWDEYREFKNRIVDKNGYTIEVYWFNSHINTDYNWTFSFGVRAKPVIKDDDSINSVRNYYRDIINKDREMITALRDVISMRDKIVDTCKPSFKKEDSIFV